MFEVKQALSAVSEARLAPRRDYYEQSKACKDKLVKATMTE